MEKTTEEELIASATNKDVILVFKRKLIVEGGIVIIWSLLFLFKKFYGLLPLWLLSLGIFFSICDDLVLMMTRIRGKVAAEDNALRVMVKMPTIWFGWQIYGIITEGLLGNRDTPILIFMSWFSSLGLCLTFILCMIITFGGRNETRLTNTAIVFSVFIGILTPPFHYEPAWRNFDLIYVLRSFLFVASYAQICFFVYYDYLFKTTIFGKKLPNNKRFIEAQPRTRIEAETYLIHESAHQNQRIWIISAFPLLVEKWFLFLWLISFTILIVRIVEYKNYYDRVHFQFEDIQPREGPKLQRIKKEDPQQRRPNPMNVPFSQENTVTVTKPFVKIEREQPPPSHSELKPPPKKKKEQFSHGQNFQEEGDSLNIIESPF